MANEYVKDSHALLGEPGAAQRAGPTAKVKKVARAAFRASIGHGAAAGGTQTGTGGASGDPTISYRHGATWSNALGKTGKFGTPKHVGKRPLTYKYDLSAYLLEY